MYRFRKPDIRLLFLGLIGLTAVLFVQAFKDPIVDYNGGIMQKSEMMAVWTGEVFSSSSHRLLSA